MMQAASVEEAIARLKALDEPGPVLESAFLLCDVLYALGASDVVEAYLNCKGIQS